MKRQQKVFEPKTGKSTATSQLWNLIGRMRKNKRAARAARSLEQIVVVLCKLAHLRS